MGHTRPYQELADILRRATGITARGSELPFGAYVLWLDPGAKVRDGYVTEVGGGVVTLTDADGGDPAVVQVESVVAIGAAGDAANGGLAPTRERYAEPDGVGSAPAFSVHFPHWGHRKPVMVRADVVIRHGGLVHFACCGEVMRTFVEDDVEVHKVVESE